MEGVPMVVFGCGLLSALLGFGLAVACLCISVLVPEAQDLKAALATLALVFVFNTSLWFAADAIGLSWGEVGEAIFHPHGHN